jgi:anion transporter
MEQTQTLTGKPAAATPADDIPVVRTAAAGSAHLAESQRIVQIGRTLAVLVPVAIWFAPLPIERPAQKAIAVTSFMIIAWITHALDHAVTGLIGCYLFWALGIVKVETAFGGFSSSTPWFLFGAVLFGTMATKSGLGRRLAYLVLRAVGSTYSRLLLGLIIADFLLTFPVPSGIARVVIMSAVAIGLIEAAGLGPGSNLGRGMFIILTYTANIFDKMIIAGAAAITAQGLIAQNGHVEVLWSRWFWAFLPVTGLTILVAWRLTLWFYPPERAALAEKSAVLSKELRTMGAWTTLEKKTAILMGIAITLWMTDRLHHISPAIVALGIALLATLPGIRVLEVEDLRKVNYLPVFFVAAAVSMSQVLSATKALDLLTKVMFGWMEPLLTNIYSSTCVLYWTAFIYHIFLGDEVSMLSASIPPLMNYATAHGLSPLVIGMIWTFGSGAKIFVYQSAVLVVGYSYGYFSSRDMFLMGAVLSVVEFIFLLLLAPFYWPLIGVR